jgi:hypothetical protein
MKKVSTVAAQQSRNISQPKLTIGLDLGDRNSWYCMLDEAGQVRREQRVRTNAKGLQEVFGAPCHAVGSRWKSGRIRPKSVACSAWVGKRKPSTRAKWRSSSECMH